MRIAVVGASGVLGRYLVPRLLSRGHDVIAVVRDPARLRSPASPALTIARADIFDPAALRAAIRGCDAAVHVATRVQRPGGVADWAMNDRIRRDGTANLVAACIAEGVRRYVQQSIAMIVPSSGNAWVDENDRIAPGDLQSAADMEALVSASPLDWRILRGGLFYGPGTGADENWAAQARAGTLVIPGDGLGWLTLVHVADYAEAMAAAIDASEGRFVLNVVDDEPATYATFYSDIAKAVGGPPPVTGGPERIESFRASNARARRELHWSPFHAGYRMGLLPGIACP